MLRALALLALAYAPSAAAQTCRVDSDILPTGELVCNEIYQFASDCFSDASRYGACSSLSYAGADDSFPFKPPAGQHAWLRLDSLDDPQVDLDLFLTRGDNCATTSTGLTCVDSSTGVSALERIDPFDSLGGTYYVSIDDYEGDWCGYEYVLTVGCSGTCAESDVARPITCSTDISDTTSGGTTKLGAYTCGTPTADLPQPNPERIYSFTPQASGEVTFRLSNLSVDQDIYVLESACDPRSCTRGSTRATTNNDEVTFTAELGKTYYIVVEAFAGVGTFTLSFIDNTGGCREDCDDGRDNDTDGQIDCADSDCADDAVCDCDADSDGVRSTTSACGGTDCNDVDPAVYPSAAEVCDGKDNNCDGQVDNNAGTTWYRDADSDGHGAAAGTLRACSQPAGYVAAGDDCDDTDPAVKPGASERCNNADDNCNGQIDEAVASADWYRDGDGDGFGAGTPTRDCKAPGAGWIEQGGDCNDSDPSVNLGAGEQCNDADDDCDGQVDEDVVDTPWYRDEDGDGWGAGAATLDCQRPTGFVAQKGDCNDADASINPDRSESCNGLDDNCDGLIDPGCDDTDSGPDDSDPDTNDSDSDDSGTTEDSDSGDDGYGSMKGCSCDTRGSAFAMGWLPALLGLAMMRRRR